MQTKPILLTILAAALLAACSRPPQSAAEPQGAGAPKAAQAVTTTIGTVEARIFETRIRADGEVTHDAVFPVVSETAGTVLEVLVDVGDTVAAGQRLVVVDVADAESRLAEAQADLKRLSAQQLEQKRVVSEYRSLRAKDFVSKRDLERAESSLSEVTALVTAAQVRLEAAQRELRRTLIVAPFEGVVASRAAKAGAFARAGEALLELRTPRAMTEVALRVPESALGKVAIGTELSARVGTEDVRGHVLRIEPTVSGAARTFTVFAALEKDSLAPGQSVVAHLIVGKDSLLAVPESAILLEGSRGFVFEVRDGVAHRVAVTRQHSAGEWVGVAGLAEGARVALSGAMFLRDGVTVTEVSQ